MAKKITNNDLFEKGLGNDIVKTFTELLAISKELRKELSGVSKELSKEIKLNPAQTAQDIDKLNTSLNKTNKTVETFTKLEKEEIRLRARLKEANSSRIDQNNVLKVQLQEQNKVNKQLARETLGLVGAYEKESKRLNILRKRFKDLAVQNKENTAEGKKLRREITQLDTKLKGIDKTVGQSQRNVGNYTSAFNKLGSALRTGLGLLGITAGVQALRSALVDSVNLYRQQEKAVAQVAAGLETTQGQVGFTLEQLKAQASALQSETLFGDEEILQGATAQLLTFTNIAGEQFSRTQQAALDLATRLDGDLKSASIQLGKALNDPVANLSALSRSGIQFSTQQKEVIKDLANSNRLADAQTIILDELNKQYGGSAKAAADADSGFKQLGNVIGDVQEIIGKVIVEGIRPFIKRLKEFAESITEADVRGFVQSLRDFGRVVGRTVKFISVLATGVAAYRVVQALSNKESKIAIFLTKGYRAAQSLLTGQIQVATIAQKAFNTATKANPLGLIIGLLATAGAAFLAYSDDIDESTESYDKNAAAAEKTRRQTALLTRELKRQAGERIKLAAAEGEELFTFETEDLEAQLERLEADFSRFDRQRKSREAAAEARRQAGKTFNAEVTAFEEKQAKRDQDRLDLTAEAIKNLREELAIRAEANAEAGKQKGLLQEINAEIARLNKLQKESRDPAVIKAIQAEVAALNEKKKALTDIGDIQKIERKEAKIKTDEEVEQLELTTDARKAEIEQQAENLETKEEITTDELALIEGLTDSIFSELQKRDSARVAQLDKEVSQRERATSTQQQRAAAGLENTLAFEKQQLAKAEAERERVQRQQERREKRLAYLKAFGELVGQDPDRAATKALAQVLIAEAIVGAFATGVENLQGPGTTTSDSMLARLSKGESVITAEATARNQGLATALNAGKENDYFINNVLPNFAEANVPEVVKFGTPTSTARIDSGQISALIGKIDSLNATIKRKKEVNVDWDSLGDMVKTTTEDGMKTVIKTIRQRPRV